jgi:hypothetical protein
LSEEGREWGRMEGREGEIEFGPLSFQISCVCANSRVCVRVPASSAMAAAAAMSRRRMAQCVHTANVCALGERVCARRACVCAHGVRASTRRACVHTACERAHGVRACPWRACVHTACMVRKCTGRACMHMACVRACVHTAAAPHPCFAAALVCSPVGVYTGALVGLPWCACAAAHLCSLLGRSVLNFVHA